MQIFEAASFAPLEAAVAQSPDVDLVLLDLNMPGAKGLSSLIYLRGERPETPVLVISANDQPRTVRRTQQFGAAGFISKSAPMQVLQQAVRAVMAGDEWFPGEKAGRSEDDARLGATRVGRAKGWPRFGAFAHETGKPRAIPARPAPSNCFAILKPGSGKRRPLTFTQESSQG